MAMLDAIASPRASADRASFTTWAMVLGALLGAFMAVLNIQITNASLLYIEGGIGTGVDNGAWISTAYLIGEIIVIPLTRLSQPRLLVPALSASSTRFCS